MARFSLIPAYGGIDEECQKSSRNISHRSTTVWTYILEKPSILCQALGCQRFCDVVEGKQRSVLLQAILTLY